MLSSLIHLHMSSLLRTERLRQDLSILLQQPPELVDVKLRHPDGRQARDFVQHIKEVACYKPHALIAYSWVMYMALFNGGRWIREQLSAARDLSWAMNKDALEFAGAYSGTLERNEAGLSFWHFEGTEDGDDIKAEFKARLMDVGTMLSPEQRADVVEEASEIFERCVGLIEEIDRSNAPGVSDGQQVDVHTIRMADMKRIRRASLIGSLLDWILQFELLRIFIAFLAWILLTIELSFGLVQPVLERNSIVLQNE